MTGYKAFVSFLFNIEITQVWVSKCLSHWEIYFKKNKKQKEEICTKRKGNEIEEEEGREKGKKNLQHNRIDLESTTKLSFSFFLYFISTQSLFLRRFFVYEIAYTKPTFSFLLLYHRWAPGATGTPCKRVRETSKEATFLA